MRLERSWLSSRLWNDFLGRLHPAAVGGPTVGYLAAPRLDSARIAGMRLQLLWNSVPGAQHYEVYRNSVPSMDGATYVNSTTDPFYEMDLNLGPGKLIAMTPSRATSVSGPPYSAKSEPALRFSWMAAWKSW